MSTPPDVDTYLDRRCKRWRDRAEDIAHEVSVLCFEVTQTGVRHGPLKFAAQQLRKMAEDFARKVNGCADRLDPPTVPCSVCRGTGREVRKDVTPPPRKALP